MKRRLPRMFRKGEVGQSIVILALGFVGLLAVVGIATDVSILFARYTQLRRAVDAAAIGAAAQMRQDRGIETVNLTARQYVEFHGLDPRDVWVDTCETLRIDIDPDTPGYQGDPSAPPVDEEVCPPDDTRKLVRVTAQVVSPTVFLKLVGWNDVTLQASAISETAVLDVVIVMDVSESMLSETTYVDWAEVGQGLAFVPPRLDLSSSSWPETGYPGANFLRETVLYKMSNASGVGFIPTLAYPGYPTYIDYISGAPSGHPLGNYYGNNPQFWWEDWFWQGHLLSVPQEEVNQRLWYPGIDGAANPDFDDPNNQFYEVRSFVPYDVQEAITEGEVPGAQGAPRESCRVRFFPYSYQLRVGSYEQGVYQAHNASWVWPQTGSETRWFGFVPTYNFYGCCNDPGNGSVDEFGNITGVTATAPDGDFSDLVCQPFKSARDATRQFLDRIDFERGDRVAFVTFDRSAHLIDPDGNGQLSPMISRFTNEDTGQTYTARYIAEKVLNTSIGVRTEPNFYIWDDNGGIFKTTDLGIGGWTRDDPSTPGTDFVPAYSQGLDENGVPIPIDYDAAGTVDDWGQNPSSYSSYPVQNNCFLQNSTMKYPATRYANRNTPARNGDAAMTNFVIPDLYTNAYWANAVNLDATIESRQMSVSAVSYEVNAACGGGNVGAALREANNALIDPTTSRREGTVWIIIFLGDGAAGHSDPARINGRLPNPPQPYQAVSNSFIYNATTNTVSGMNQYGTRGEYGFYGVCPPGGPQVADYAGGDRDQLGELVLVETPGDEPSFPYCSDESPYTRHFCVPTVQAAIGGDSSVGYPNYEAGFGPQALDIIGADKIALGEPVTEQNYYDIDIGIYGQEDFCSNLYDVDDYARDWADFVAGVGQLQTDVTQAGGDDAVLPTVFTIGFGLTFDNGGTTQEEICVRNPEDCLGEELLRYIADAGDNFSIDNDFQQDLRWDLSLGTPDDELNGGNGGYGPKDPCQAQDVNYDPNNPGATIASFPHGESCGNYYNAPGQAELAQVFDDIASRMFTRLAG